MTYLLVTYARPERHTTTSLETCVAMPWLADDDADDACRALHGAFTSLGLDITFEAQRREE